MSVSELSEFGVTEWFGLVVSWVVCSWYEAQRNFFAWHVVSKYVCSHVDVSLFFVVLYVLCAMDGRLVVDIECGDFVFLFVVR